MASNRRVLLILITALCLTAPASLWAQSSGYYMELRFVQRLTWVGDEYASRYEVIIEKEEDGKYKRVLQEFTTAFFIEVSLSHGKYRYQVIPYDFFDLPVPATEWMDFEVQRREIIMVNPDEPENNNEIKEHKPEPETKIVYKNLFDIYLGLAWIPNLPIYGEDEPFSESPSLYGAGLRLAIVSAKQKIINFGMEGSASWRLSPGDQPMQSLTFDLNALARLSSAGNVAFNFRAGAGVYLRSGEIPVSSNGQYAIHANLGVSFIWLLVKHLYLEAGMEYVHFFTNSGYLRPSVGFGYKF